MHHASCSKSDHEKEEEDLKNEDNLRNEDKPKNEDDLQNEDNLKNEDTIKNEDNNKNKNFLTFMISLFQSKIQFIKPVQFIIYCTIKLCSSRLIKSAPWPLG